MEGGRDRCKGRVEHDGKRFGNIEDVDGEDAGLAIVELVEDWVFYISYVLILLTGHGIQEPVFVTIHASRSDNGGFGEGVTDSTFTSRFAAVEFGWRGAVGVEVRDVDKAWCAVLCRHLGNQARGSDISSTVVILT